MVVVHTYILHERSNKQRALKSKETRISKSRQEGYWKRLLEEPKDVELSEVDAQYAY